MKSKVEKLFQAYREQNFIQQFLMMIFVPRCWNILRRGEIDDNNQNVLISIINSSWCMSFFVILTDFRDGFNSNVSNEYDDNIDVTGFFEGQGLDNHLLGGRIFTSLGEIQAEIDFLREKNQDYEEESDRVINMLEEKIRQDAEKTRQDAEEKKQLAEKTRQDAEEKKQLAEKIRQDAEEKKQLAEKIRQDAEKIRQDAEEKKQLEEEKKQIEEINKISKIEKEIIKLYNKKSASYCNLITEDESQLILDHNLDGIIGAFSLNEEEKTQLTQLINAIKENEDNDEAVDQYLSILAGYIFYRQKNLENKQTEEENKLGNKVIVDVSQHSMFNNKKEINDSTYCQSQHQSMNN